LGFSRLALEVGLGLGDGRKKFYYFVSFIIFVRFISFISFICLVGLVEPIDLGQPGCQKKFGPFLGPGKAYLWGFILN
jgi:hypothetical protein